MQLEYNYKIMNDEEDEFFVQPEIEEVHDIKLIQSPNEITDKVVQQTKIIPLKMLEIPKQQQNVTYRPFRFEHHESSEEQNEEFPDFEDTQSPFLDCYRRQQCIYQKNHNQLYNKVNDCTYFSGAFLHRNIFLEGNYSNSYELDDVVKNYYQTSKDPLPCGEEDDIKFDSHFESGNLFAAFKIGPYEYDLVMSNDVNSIGNNQWFYFSVENMIPDRDYTFSVVNFTKSDSLFNYGMAPAVYSLAENKQIFGIEKGWRRQGRDISYKKGTMPRQNSRRMYYKLSFKLKTLYEKDKIYIAHSYPYTNQKLVKYIDDKISKNKQYVTRVVIGKTLSKRSIEAFKISQQVNNKKKDTRKAIIVMARQHPGETQGSYVCQGVIDKILSKSKESEILIKNFVIYVIPMVNPDGVAFGHYRTNLSGKDLNRKWNATDKDLNCPEVSIIKTFIQEISKQRQIRFILDLHGHSKKLNSFFYANPCPENPDVVRIFPYVCSKLHPGVQYLDCTFSAQQQKRKAARVYLSYLYRLIHVYTFESSFYAYFKDGKKIQFTPKQFRELGGTLINALSMQLDHEIRFQQSFQFNIKKNNTKQFLTSPFVKILSELKNNQELLQHGCQLQSGSQSKPEETEVNIEQMQGFKPIRPSSTPTAQQSNISKTVNISRRGRRDPKQFNFNKPIRNIKFLEISRVNSVLPDKYQLGLQPIKKKQVVTEIVKPFTGFGKISAEVQTNPKNQLRLVSFKRSQIEACLLSNSVKFDMLQERKYSSLIRSNNRNIIFKFDMFGQTTARQQDCMQKTSLRYQHAYSQTMITYSRQQGEKIKSSQVISSVETPQRDEKRWARNNSIRVESTVKNSRRQQGFYFNGMIKKLVTEKEPIKFEQYSTKFILQKPLSIIKKQITKK